MITFLSDLSRLGTSTAFWFSFVLFVLSYLKLAPRCATVKQRSWLLTLLSSAVMSIFSLPLVVQYVSSGGQLKEVAIPPIVADSASRFFQAYLFADLTMGTLFYPSKVNLLTGWIHHSVYVFIVDFAIQRHWSHIFCLCAVMEVPTFVLALGSILPHLRSDVFFALCFFSTRIALHIILSVSLLIQRHEATDGSLYPAILTTCIFPLHAYWFSGSIKVFLKQRKPVGQSVPPTTSPINVSASPERPMTPTSPSVPGSFYPSRASLARRRTALRIAMRARWDQLRLWKASGRLDEVQRRVRAALPGRERVYEYVGLERRRYSMPSISVLSEQDLAYSRDATPSPVSEPAIS